MMRVRDRVLRIVAQLALLAVVLVVGSCGVTHKVLKSNDPELMYRVGVQEYDDQEWGNASKLFAAVESYYEGTQKEDSLKFFIARCSYKINDYNGALEQLDEFRRTYGRSVFLEDAEGMYTMCYYFLSPPANRDQKLTETAIITIDEFLSRYPNSSQVETFKTIRQELVGRLHKKSFDNAYTYYKIGRYKSAIVAFKNANKEYPESELREDILYYTVASAYELAYNSVVDKKEDRYLAMIDSYYTFIAEFPESEWRPKVDKMLKEGREYIAYLKEMEGKDKTVEREIFWKRLFGKHNKEESATKEVEE